MKWIAIENKLPPENIRILFIVKDDSKVYYGETGEFDEFYYCDFEFPYGLDLLDKTVTHWMLMPKPPKKAKK